MRLIIVVTHISVTPPVDASPATTGARALASAGAGPACDRVGSPGRRGAAGAGPAGSSSPVARRQRRRLSSPSAAAASPSVDAGRHTRALFGGTLLTSTFRVYLYLYLYLTFSDTPHTKLWLFCVNRHGVGRKQTYSSRIRQSLLKIRFTARLNSAGPSSRTSAGMSFNSLAER